MSLFNRADFELCVQRLPHSFLVHQWGGASVAKVGTTQKSKIFAILSDWSTDAPAISFKCSDMSYHMLRDLVGIRPAPYLARAKWVQVSGVSALSAYELAAYIDEAHKLAFKSLPKAKKEQLAAVTPVAQD